MFRIVLRRIFPVDAGRGFAPGYSFCLLIRPWRRMIGAIQPGTKHPIAISGGKHP
jgi:hypothetical protein